MAVFVLRVPLAASGGSTLIMSFLTFKLRCLVLLEPGRGGGVPGGGFMSRSIINPFPAVYLSFPSLSFSLFLRRPLSPPPLLSAVARKLHEKLRLAVDRSKTKPTETEHLSYVYRSCTRNRLSEALPFDAGIAFDWKFTKVFPRTWKRGTLVGSPREIELRATTEPCLVFISPKTCLFCSVCAPFCIWLIAGHGENLSRT